MTARDFVASVRWGAWMALGAALDALRPVVARREEKARRKAGWAP